MQVAGGHGGQGGAGLGMGGQATGVVQIWQEIGDRLLACVLEGRRVQHVAGQGMRTQAERGERLLPKPQVVVEHIGGHGLDRLLIPDLPQHVEQDPLPARLSRIFLHQGQQRFACLTVHPDLRMVPHRLEQQEVHRIPSQQRDPAWIGPDARTLGQQLDDLHVGGRRPHRQLLPEEVTDAIPITTLQREEHELEIGEEFVQFQPLCLGGREPSPHLPGMRRLEQDLGDP